MAHKQRWTFQYTETVYYGDDGEEVGRERHMDDHAYDSGPTEPMTEQEQEDWL